MSGNFSQNLKSCQKDPRVIKGICKKKCDRHSFKYLQKYKRQTQFVKFYWQPIKIAWICCILGLCGTKTQGAAIKLSKKLKCEIMPFFREFLHAIILKKSIKSSSFGATGTFYISNHGFFTEKPQNFSKLGYQCYTHRYLAK